ncbi:PucR family transcriptional regulator [Streptomyces sp. NPDC050560]|uniref:PucR family transcriptional regulator n=1 Tax=Streptomyces sp. NPDC050560 TaxID=3365630 RepID=UPI0037AF80B8
MKGLLLRLSSLDADAAAAVRVIAHFQALLGGGPVEPLVLVRSTAGLARCPAGMEPAEGHRVRCAPDGSTLPGAPGRVSGSVELPGGGRVWLERAGAPGPLDALVLEWLALAARMGGAGHGGRAPQAADPALVELALSGREAAADRVRALRLLGLNPARALRVAAADAGPGAEPGVETVALLARSALPAVVRVAAVGRLTATLVQPRDGADSPAAALRRTVVERSRELRGGGARVAGTRFGIGGSVAAELAPLSWAQARTALRFAAGGGPEDEVVDHDALGPLALLADLPAARLRAEPGVRALAELAGRDGAELSVAALAAFCRHGSLRRAAAALHLHHSSVAARLAQVESALGWRLGDPGGLLRAQLALYAWRLSRSDDATGDGAGDGGASGTRGGVGDGAADGAWDGGGAGGAGHGAGDGGGVGTGAGGAGGTGAGAG